MGTQHDLLHGGLWHSTRPDQVPSIFASGEIKVEPNIDDNERWGSRDHPGFVRKMGGISLFDFHGFEPADYAISHPASSWGYFVPHRDDWKGAVWLKIDRAAMSDTFVSADKVVERWKETRSYRHRAMPRIEAAHLGNLPVTAISSAFLTWDRGREVRGFDTLNFDPDYFEKIIAEWHEAIGNE